MGCLKPSPLMSSIYLEKFMHSLWIHLLCNSKQIMNNIQIILSCILSHIKPNRHTSHSYSSCEFIGWECGIFYVALKKDLVFKLSLSNEQEAGWALSQSGHFRKNINILPLPENKPWFLGYAVHIYLFSNKMLQGTNSIQRNAA